MLALCFFACKEKPKKITVTGKEGQDIVAFDFLVAKSKRQLDFTKFDSGKSLILLYFSPTCKFCRVETRRLARNADDFSSSRIVLASSADLKDIRAYSEEFGLKKLSNVIVVQDTSRSMPKYFKSTGVPFLAIYNKEHKLVRAYSGLTDIKELKKALTL